MSDCIFCRIAAGTIPAERVYEDGDLVAFRDLHPQAPTHVLLVPKKHIATLNDLTPDDAPLIGRMYLVAAQLAAQEGIAESGYRTIFNCNADGGQVIFHLHLHLLGGRVLSSSPG